MALGSSESKSFTVTNTGGTAVEITKSKPPIGGDFAATTSLSEGTTIAPGESLTETVKFTPTEVGPASADWPINGKDATGPHDVQFSGIGVVQGQPTGEANEHEHPTGETLVQPIGGGLGSSSGSGGLGCANTSRFLGAQLASRALTPSAAGVVGVRVSCPAGESSCAGTIALRVLISTKAPKGAHSKSPKKPISLIIAEGSFTVAGGAVSTIKLHLSRRARALLARAHALRAEATLASHDPAGATYTAQGSVTIRAPRKPLSGKPRRRPAS